MKEKAVLKVLTFIINNNISFNIINSKSFQDLRRYFNLYIIIILYYSLLLLLLNVY